MMDDGKREHVRPAWVDDPAEPPAAEREEAWPPPGPGLAPRAHVRVPRHSHQPMPGKHAEDGLWEHVLVTGGIVTLCTWLAAVAMPHSWPLLLILLACAVITAVTWYTAINLTDSPSMANYLGIWGFVLTGWMAAARLTSPWKGVNIFMLALAAIALIPAGVTVIRRYRDRVNRAADTGRDTVRLRECRYWEGLLQRLGTHNVVVRDVIRTDNGRQLHCRLGKAADGRSISAMPDADTARRICVQRRLPPGAVYIEEAPQGGSAADFIVHINEAHGPRLTRWLPAENSILSINGKFPLGVLDTGKEWMLRLREVVVFICGVRGSGKSTLLNIFIAQLCRMPDAVIFMIDLKGGQEARMWLMPWVLGLTDRPAIDWLATTREEAKDMLDALWRAGTARAESGRYGRKLRPSKDAPAIIVICDETAVMTGHMIREDGLSAHQLSTRLLQIAETFRSVAIDPVVAAVRAVVDVTGNSGIKAMAEVRIGMKVATVNEGQAIFPDNYAAAQQLAQLKDKGMGIPKVGADLHPPVHFFNITDGEPDDDGHPTADRITPVVLATAARRPAPEQLVIDAMNEVRVMVRAGDREQEMGAYEARWESEHIKALIETWRTEAGLHDDPRPRPARVPEDEEGAWDDIVAGLDGVFGDAEPALDDGDGRRKLNPARKRLYEILIERRSAGGKVDPMWHQLQSEGHDVTRQTVHDWLNQAEKQGYVIRAGKARSPGSRWIWHMSEGAEFGIPGWD